MSTGVFQRLSDYCKTTMVIGWFIMWAELQFVFPPKNRGLGKWVGIPLLLL